MTPDSVWKLFIKKIKPEHKYAFFGTVVIGLMAHLYVMTNHFLTFDSMWNLYSDQDMITSARQFLTYACSVGSYYDLPYVNGLLAIFYLAVTASLLVEALHIEGKVLSVIVGGLLVTFPSVASTFAYTYTIDGYMLAVLLAVLAFLVTDRYRFGFLGGLVCLGFSLGIYQADFSFTILLCIFALMLYILEGSTVKELLSKVWRYLVMGVGGYLFYFVTLKIMLSVKGAEISGYQGTDKITSFSLSDLPAGLKAAWDSFYYFFRYGGAFSATGAMKVFYLLFFIMGLVSFVYLFVKRKAYKNPLNIVLTLVLAACVPFGACIISILSPDTYFHLLMRMPWVVILEFFAALISLMFKDNEAIKPYETAVSLVSVVSALILILQFGVAANIAYFNLNERYEKTYALCVRLVDRIESYDGYTKDMPVAILGGFPDSEYYPSTDITAEDLSGYFGVDGDYAVNSSGSIETFCERYLNFSFNTLSTEEEINLTETEEFAEMSNFPSSESFKIIDGVLVIKFNG